MKKVIKTLSNRMPWWLKIASKVALSRLPVAYETWQRIGIFKHGYMDTAEYALSVFNLHASNCGLGESLRGKTVLELGPGDSIATAIIACSYGARSILLDAGRFARIEPSVYERLANELTKKGLKAPSLDGVTDIKGVLERCGSSYLTRGLLDLKEVPNQSVDLIFSQAVLEHVRRHEFNQLMKECRRVLAATGVASHVVDLKDHLGGGANNLRLPHKLWESDLFAGSGFYTNRLRCGQIVASLTQAGFSVVQLKKQWHSKLPISRDKVHPDIEVTSDEDLLVKEIELVLRPA